MCDSTWWEPPSANITSYLIENIQLFEKTHDRQYERGCSKEAQIDRWVVGIERELTKCTGESASDVLSFFVLFNWVLTVSVGKH